MGELDTVITDGGAAAGLTHEELEEMVAEGEIELTEDLNHGAGYSIDTDPNELSVGERLTLRHRPQPSSPSSGQSFKRETRSAPPVETQKLEAQIGRLTQTIQGFEKIFAGAVDEIASARATAGPRHTIPPLAEPPELVADLRAAEAPAISEELDSDTQIYQCCTMDGTHGARRRVPSREAPMYGHRF